MLSGFEVFGEEDGGIGRRCRCPRVFFGEAETAWVGRIQLGDAGRSNSSGRWRKPAKGKVVGNICYEGILLASGTTRTGQGACLRMPSVTLPTRTWWRVPWPWDPMTMRSTLQFFGLIENGFDGGSHDEFGVGLDPGLSPRACAPSFRGRGVPRAVRGRGESRTGLRAGPRSPTNSGSGAAAWIRVRRAEKARASSLAFSTTASVTSEKSMAARMCFMGWAAKEATGGRRSNGFDFWISKPFQGSLWLPSKI